MHSSGFEHLFLYSSRDRKLGACKVGRPFYSVRSDFKITIHMHTYQVEA